MLAHLTPPVANVVAIVFFTIIRSTILKTQIAGKLILYMQYLSSKSNISKHNLTLYNSVFNFNVHDIRNRIEIRCYVRDKYFSSVLAIFSSVFIIYIHLSILMKTLVRF